MYYRSIVMPSSLPRIHGSLSPACLELPDENLRPALRSRAEQGNIDCRLSRERGRESTHYRYGRWFDLDQKPHLARLRIRILVFAQILLRQRVDVRVGPLFRRTVHTAAHLDMAVWIVGMMIASATGAPSFMLRALTLPFAVFTRIVPSS